MLNCRDVGPVKKPRRSPAMPTFFALFNIKSHQNLPDTINLIEHLVLKTTKCVVVWEKTVNLYKKLSNGNI